MGDQSRTEYKVAEHCYMGCICDFLWKKGYEVEEAAVFLKNTPVLSMYSSDAGFKSNVTGTVKKFCRNTGLHLNVISGIDGLEDLRRYKNHTECILCGVNSRELHYAKAFSEGLEDTHFINIYGVTDSGIVIKDSYIPTKPVSSYEGEYEISDTFFEGTMFWGYDLRQFNLKTNYAFTKEDFFPLEDMFKIELDILDEPTSKEVTIGKKAWEKYISDIEELYDLPGEEIERKAYKMATDLATSGGVAARKYLLTVLINIGFEREKVEELQEILNGYFLLQLLLVKISFTKSKKEISRLKRNLMELEEKEIDFFQEMLQFINRRKENGK